MAGWEKKGQESKLRARPPFPYQRSSFFSSTRRTCLFVYVRGYRVHDDACVFHRDRIHGGGRRRASEPGDCAVSSILLPRGRARLCIIEVELIYNDSRIRGGREKEKDRRRKREETNLANLAASPRLPATNSLAAYPGHDGGIFSRGDGNRGSASKGRTIRDLRMSLTSTRNQQFFIGMGEPPLRVTQIQTLAHRDRILHIYRAPKGGRPMTEREEWYRGQDDLGLPHTSRYCQSSRACPRSETNPVCVSESFHPPSPITALSPRTHSRP